MDRNEEIIEFMLEMFQVYEIQDTTENRLEFLKGIQQAWREDKDVSLEKALYQISLTGEIMVLSMRLKNEQRGMGV